MHLSVNLYGASLEPSISHGIVLDVKSIQKHTLHVLLVKMCGTSGYGKKIFTVRRKLVQDSWALRAKNRFSSTVIIGYGTTGMLPLCGQKKAVLIS